MSYVGIFALLLILSSLAACGLGLYALTRRDVPSASAFALMLAGEFVWATGYLRELGADSLQLKIFWDNVQFIGAQLSGVGALCFALVYTGRGLLLQRLRPLLWIEPLITTVLVWTASHHSLIRVDARIDASSGYPQLVYGYGPWFWVSSVYNLALGVIALGMLIAFAARTGSRYRQPIIAMVAGLSVPVLGVLLTLSGLVPVAGLRNLDISPLTFAVANAVIAWGLFRRRLLDVVPIARAQLIDHLSDAVVVADVERVVVDCNPRGERLLAHGGASIRGFRVGVLWPALADLMCPDLASDSAAVLTLDAADGPRYLEVSVSPIRTSRGHLTGWLALLRDVTEQRRAAELLRERELFISRVNQATPDIVYVYDLAERRVIYSNRASLQLTGYGPELLQAMGSAVIPTVMHPDDLSRLARHRARLLAASDDDVLSVEYRVLRADGRQRLLRGRDIVFARDAAGLPRQILGMATDVTAEREAAAALVQAKEAAEAADRAKSAFLATMSHEIRTPLNAVIGMADLLLLAELPPDLRDYAATIRTGGQALLAIINNILDLSKIGAGKVELEERPFDLGACIDEAAGLFAHSAAMKGVTLRTELDPALPGEVVGDVTRLRQVVVNLLSNAVKFTDEGEIVVAARATLDAEGKAEVTITVRDTGIGITPEAQAALFRPFAQADSSTTRRFGGTGLGLAISKQLVELMGGTIRVESTWGAGATFTVHVALRRADAPPAAAHGARPLAGRRALVIEGDRATREHVAALLQRLGAAGQAVAGGGDALAQAAAGARWDLAIVGLRLAGLGALATAQALRGMPGLQHMPLLLLVPEGAEASYAERAAFADVLQARTLGVQLRAVAAGLREGAAPPAARAPALAPLQVLVVEDNPINQQVTARMLGSLGHDVTVASGGQAALAAIERHSYDLVLMDIRMPDLDGVEVTARIRAMGERIVQPRIVAFTASALAGDRERYLAAGMDDYLGKPVQLKALEALLSRAPARAAAKAAGPPGP